MEGSNTGYCIEGKYTAKIVFGICGETNVAYDIWFISLFKRVRKLRHHNHNIVNIIKKIDPQQNDKSQYILNSW